MVLIDLFNQRTLTAILLILSFVAFAIGGTLPVLGHKGNTRIFTLPAQEHLLAVANNVIVWRWANIFMASAVVLLLAGLTLLADLAVGANERVLSRLGLVGFILAAGFWLIFSTFRIVVTIRAAREMTASGTTGRVPSYYEPWAQWAFGLFYVYAILGYLAWVAYGGSLLQVALLPAWAGWATLVFSFATLLLLLVRGDTLPGFHYLPALLIGILLLLAA